MVRVGVAGLGAWGWNVARSFADLKDCELVSCCDIDPEENGLGQKSMAMGQCCG